ncbi:MAG TPA: TatD family hydrolase [Phycisphaerae bacterium]|jgi:TatD DNase family protein|nr:TatD family hydrolase [Phycisphaerae bacterium]HOB75642.1 TatD family hydrolase [Phycisphaerae bacterium]HOJ56315.1 TatD family hydrolase [Phycisphaerae bacterium]HOL28184.1 TatD family hydrolase [Phycisphaerae bacterium]HPP22462.1 TatD family hydrolase [Phycisphaerae bacterium]
MLPGLFDTHCHLTAPELLARREQVLSAAAAVGVSHVLTVACVPAEFDAAINLAASAQGQQRDDSSAESASGGPRPVLYVATGIHPHEAARVQESDWEALKATWRQPHVVAAGEMGLDYHYDFSPRDVQRAVFERQLDLAAAADLPLIIHCRNSGERASTPPSGTGVNQTAGAGAPNAQEDAIEILIRHGFEHKPVVFHCFTGTPEEAAELRSHGWWTSFTGLITFKNAGPQRQACLETSPDQLMFETDAPYLSPEPVRRMRPNEPRNLVHTVRFAAQLRGEAFEDLAARSTANARRFFRL